MILDTPTIITLVVSASGLANGWLHVRHTELRKQMAAQDAAQIKTDQDVIRLQGEIETERRLRNTMYIDSSRVEASVVSIDNKLDVILREMSDKYITRREYDHHRT